MEHNRSNDLETPAFRWAWAIPLVPIAVSMFCLSALVYYHTAMGGEGEAWGFLQGLVLGLYRTLGFVPSFMFWLLVFAWSSIWFVTGHIERIGARLVWLGAFTLSLAILVNIGTDGISPPVHAGSIGTFIATRLTGAIGYALSALLAVGASLASLLLATEFLFYRYFEALGRAASPGLATEPGVEPEATAAFRELATLLPTGSAPVDGGGAPVRRRLVLDDDSLDATAVEVDAVEADDPGEDDPAIDGADDDPDAVEPRAEIVDEAAESEADPAIGPKGDAEPGPADFDLDAGDDEPIVAIPQPVEAPRQQDLFGGADAAEPEPAVSAGADPALEQAAQTVFAAGRASTVLLRRRLHCSPGEASDLLDRLRAAGAVGGAAGEPSGPLTMSAADWDARR